MTCLLVSFCSEMLGRAMVDATEGIDADRDPTVHNNNNNNNGEMFGENCSPNRFGGYGGGGGNDTDQYGNWSEGWSGLPSDGDFFKNLNYTTDEQPWLYPGDEEGDGGDGDGLETYASASSSSSSAINFLAGLREDVLPLPPPPPSSSTQSSNAPMEI